MPKKLSASPKVLFIDDHQAFLDMYGLKFKQAGFKVLVCQDSTKIVKQAIIFKPDLIFLDLVMNKQDGLEVLKKLKNTCETKWIPIIMLTNIDNNVDKEECLKLGASHYLIKLHFTPSELLQYAVKILRMI